SQNLSVAELQAAQDRSPPRVSLAVLRATSMVREEQARGILLPDQPTPAARRARAAKREDAVRPSANGDNRVANPEKAGTSPSPDADKGAVNPENAEDPPSSKGDNGADLEH